MSENLVHQCKNGQQCHDENHMCRLIIKKDFDRLKKIAKDAKYICLNCGRAASQKENLCNPSSL